LLRENGRRSITAPTICAWQATIAVLESIRHFALGLGWVLSYAPIDETDTRHVKDFLSASMGTFVSKPVSVEFANPLR
jgi:hypothetical protein